MDARRRGRPGPGGGRRRTGRLARLGRGCSRVRRPRGVAGTHAERRAGAVLLHVGDDEGSEGGPAHARVHLRAPLDGRLLARSPAHRPALDDVRHRLGEGGVRRALRAVDERRRRRSCTTVASIPSAQLDLLERYEISTFCAPPTEYRLLVKQDLARCRLPRLRHCTGAGEPLNPEVIHAWHDALRAADPRRLRTDGEHHAGRQPAGAADPSGLDGKAVPGTRPARHRRRRCRAAGRRGGRPRAPRAPAVALPRVLEEPRGDRRVPCAASGT